MPFYPLLTIAVLSLVEIANHIYIKFYSYFPFLRFFSFLGIAIHEYLHAFACVITGAKIHEIKIHPTRGHVKHGPSWFGTPGNILISMAPLIGGIALLYLLTGFILGLSPFEIHEQLLKISSSSSPEEFLNNIQSTGNILINSISSLGFRIPLIIFLLLNLAATITPSGRDYLNVIYGLLATLIISTLLYLVPLEALRDVLDFICFQIITILIFTLAMYLLLITLLAILVIITKLASTNHVRVHIRKRK